MKLNCWDVSVRLKVLKLTPDAELDGQKIRRETTCEEMQAILAKRGCDSIWLPRDRPEFIVYNTDQVKEIVKVPYVRDV